MASVASQEIRNNRATCGCWKTYSQHRARIGEEISRAAFASRAASNQAELTFCALGAGNLNDIDLGQLLSLFGQIHLVDIDRSAVENGIERQAAQSADVKRAIAQKRIVVHAPFDVTSVAHLLCGDESTADSKEELSQRVVRALSSQSARSDIATNVDAAHGGLEATMDVVVSLSMVSQLIRQVQEAFRGNSSQWHPIADLIVDAHLKLMNRLLNPGGSALLVTDVIGATTGAQELLNLTSQTSGEVEQTSQQLIEQGKHFPFLTPREVVIRLSTLNRVFHVSTSPFWLWDISQNVRYMCSCVHWLKTTEASDDGAQQANVPLSYRINQFMQRTGVALTSLGHPP